MKRYIRSEEVTSDTFQNYFDRIREDVDYNLEDVVQDTEWATSDGNIYVHVTFMDDSEHDFTFEDWRLTYRTQYIDSDVDMILNNISSYMKAHHIQSKTEGFYTEWEVLETKQVLDSDEFWDDYTLWYNEFENRYVCIFGDIELHNPDNTEPDFECETEDEAFEWFDDYKGPGEEDNVDDVESSVQASENNKEWTATDIVNWMYKDFKDYEFYDERDLSNDRVRLIFETGKNSLKDDVISALESRNIQYHFSPSGARLLIDAPDDYDTEYIGEYDRIESSAEFFDKGDGQEYWYFTRHGVMPGSVPRGLDILDVQDAPGGSYFLTNKVLTTDALKYYDIKEKTPEGITSYFDPIEDMDAEDTIGELVPGDVFQNRNGVTIKILEPTKDGQVQYAIGDEVRLGSPKSIQKMLYRNNYMRM